MDYTKKTREELITACKEKGITGYSAKRRNDIIALLLKPAENTLVAQDNTDADAEANANTEADAEADAEAENKLRMIDLFAGTGAFTHAFEQTGKVTCVFANDMVEWSKKIYDENFTHKLTLEDLNSVKLQNIPPHDILTGGFPCQPFSIAGKQEGFDDKRSNVFWKILEIIDHHKPRCVILENVKNLVSHDDKKTFETIIKNLTDRGYHIRTKVLDTAEITGIPQHRERIYIVCIKDKNIYDKFTLDFPAIQKRALSTMFTSDAVDAKYYYTEASSTWPLVTEAVTKQNTIYQYRRVYVRENKSNECPTLTANMGGGGHNVPIILDSKGIRKLTPRECFTFQGFPQSYKLPALSDTHLYKLAGNAVSVPVVKLIANRLIPLLMPSQPSLHSLHSLAP
jgi:DNA (cytosine-5)-methyltransferase 1